ncbi:hypothetical protein MUG91_G17n39 [Manis pentadactyla]|nr:hypothetical protein MUG91_G17n39 [Manis pentadactyla]
MGRTGVRSKEKQMSHIPGLEVEKRPDGILGHHETLQLEAEWFIYTPSPPYTDTGDEKGSCLLSEAGVVGLNRKKMSSWKDASTSCPGQSA